MASVTTTHDAIQNVTGKILSSLIPGGAIASPFVTSILERYTKLGHDQLGAPLWTDMTPVGVERKRLNDYAGTVGDTVASEALTGEQRNIYAGIQRSLVSKQAYGEKHGLSGKQLTERYEQYISDQVDGMMANPVMGALYKALDPSNTAETGAYMSQATANLIRNGMAKGDQTAAIKARELTSRVFTSDDGKSYQFDKKQFGGMSQQEVAALTAALTKDADLDRLTNGADANDTKKLGDAAKAFQEKVKAFSSAIAPLKDVFGNDVPGMLKTIEEVSGQQISQISASRAAQLTNNIMARTQTGAYSIGEAAAMSEQLNKSYEQMNMSSVSRLMAPNVGLYVMDSINGGLRPSTMTAKDWSGSVADMRIRESAARNTQHVAQAYALWKQRKGNEKATFEDFQAEAVRKGYDTNATDALLKVAGVSSIQALSSGMNYGTYTEAIQSGQAARMNSRAAGSARTTATRIALRGQTDLRRQMGRRTDATIDKAIAALETNAALLDPSARDARDQFFKENKIDNRTADEMTMVWNRIAQDDKFKDYRVDVTAKYNQRQQDRAASRADSMRKATKDIEIANNPKELVAEGIKNGFSDEWIQDKLNTGNKLNVSTADTRRLLSTRAMGSELERMGQVTKGDTIVDYSLSQHGTLNRGFMRELDNYINAGTGTSKKERNARENAAVMANLYRTLGEDAVDTFIGTDKKNADRRRELLITAAKHTENPEAAYNLVQNTAILKQINQMSGASRATFKEILKDTALSESDLKIDTKDRLPQLRAKAEAWVDQHEEKRQDVNEILSALSRASSTPSGAPATFDNTLLRLTQTLDNLTALIKTMQAKELPKGVQTERAYL